MNIENIASELIILKREAELAEKNYQDKRTIMYNKLTNTQQNTFEYDGFKFTKTKDTETRNITKEKLWDALNKADISDELCSQIYSDSQNEKPRLSNLQITELK